MKRMLQTFSCAMLCVIWGCGGGGGDGSRGTTEETQSLTHGTIVSQPASNTGIEGVVMATVPDLVPGSIRFRREPVQGAEIAIVRAVDNVEIATVFSDSQGRFSVELRPGSYVLVPRNELVNGDLMRAPSQILPIIPGRISRIFVEYESGILL